MIGVFTSGRWDYNYLRKIIEKLGDDCEVFYPSNHHLANELKGIRIGNADSIFLYGSFYSSALNHIAYMKPEMVVVLGDRFETQAVVTACLLLNIPVSQIHAGETTEGSFDDQLRNSISMMSTICFASTVQYKNKLDAMGVKRAYNVGSPVIDYIKSVKLEPKRKYREEYVVATLHPTTKELDAINYQVTNFYNALLSIPYKKIIIMPNTDPESNVIRHFYKERPFNPNFEIVENVKDYYSLIANSKMVIGNSSSGIIETPSFKIPTVNIGNRQKGRTRGGNVIDCGHACINILDAIEKAETLDLSKMRNPYGGGGSCDKIIKIINEYRRK